MKIVYHCTTPRKLEKYKRTGCILPPVRYWTSEESALKWMRRVNRTVLLMFIEPERSYPLPIKHGAKWSDGFIKEWMVRHVVSQAVLKTVAPKKAGGSTPSPSDMERQADGWRRHLPAKEASVTALQVRSLSSPSL